MTLEQRLTALAQSIAADIKNLLSTRGNLATLNTTSKTSLVAAINEVFSLTSSGSVIDDNAASNSTAKTYSANKVTALLAQVKSEIIGGASSAYDTLIELQNLLQTDQTAISGLLTAVGKRVAVDQAQSFTTGEKLQARQNIDAYGSVEIGNPDRNFVSDYTTARDS
ncbi:MAG TPA: hypothetical protein PKY59_10290 [Pyrinomonadaceae bacterium]|nr:hypothetical protein [Pyrinomonadaceae bacterium]